LEKQKPGKPAKKHFQADKNVYEKAAHPSLPPVKIIQRYGNTIALQTSSNLPTRPGRKCHVERSETSGMVLIIRCLAALDMPPPGWVTHLAKCIEPFTRQNPFADAPSIDLLGYHNFKKVVKFRPPGSV
jgi:hypothetical protein